MRPMSEELLQFSYAAIQVTTKGRNGSPSPGGAEFAHQSDGVAREAAPSTGSAELTSSDGAAREAAPSTGDAELTHSADRDADKREPRPVLLRREPGSPAGRPAKTSGDTFRAGFAPSTCPVTQAFNGSSGSE